MTILLKQIFNFLKLLNSETGTNQIAAGISAGLILGFSPFLSLQTFLLIVLLLVFRIQIGAATIFGFFFSFCAYLLDPVCNVIGMSVLESEALHSLFTSLYNMPLLPYTKFNNSIVMGSAVVSFLLSIPVFFLSKILITKYRQHVVAKFQQTKFWKLVKATAFYKWYATYDQLY